MQTATTHETIIPFAPYRERQDRYNDRLRESTEYLEKVAGELITAAINLAVNNAWAAWDEEQPEGTEVGFDPEMLLYCPDEKVRRIMLIWQQIMNFLWDEEVVSNP